MPADFFIDTNLRMVFSKAKGVCGRADATDHMDRLLAHPDFDPKFSQLIDYREMTAVNITHDELRMLALRTIFSPTSRRAFVAPEDEKFGVGRTFASYREMAGETGIHVFREMDKALAWLELSAEPDSRLFSRLQG